MVCDSDSQYCLNAIPYIGIGSVPPAYQHLLQGEYFTMELLRPHLLQPGRVVCADNWFTSYQLARSLQRESMHLVGTILKKPQLPCQYILDCKVPLKQNLAIYNHTDRINVVFKRVKPKKVLGVITTIHNVFSNVEDNKTEANMFYNASKGGVDSFDQMCAHNDIGRKTRRWPLCIFYGLLNIVMTNAWVIFTSRPANRLKSRHDFSQDLAYNLARPHARQRYRKSQLFRRELRDQIRLLFKLDDDVGQEEQQPGDDEGPPAPPRPDQAAPGPSQPREPAAPGASQPREPAAPGASQPREPAVPGAYQPRQPAVPGPSRAREPARERRFQGGRILDEKRQRCHFCRREVVWRGKEKCNSCLKNICHEHSRITCMDCWEER